MLAAVVAAAAVGFAAPCFLSFAAASVAAAAVHNAQPYSTKRSSRDDTAMLDELRSQQRLRRTIESTVLSGLANGMMEHREKVARGELRPRPFVTLTYAQSIDGSIAAADKSQVFLSGSESRTMTHGLRSIHDAILVGAGTVRQDNPRLNIRHWPPAKAHVDLSDALDDGYTRSSSSCSDGLKASFAPGGCGEKGAEEEERGLRDRPTGSGRDCHAVAERGGSRQAAPEPSPSPCAPRAVILAGSLSELPRSMRLGGALIFTDLSSPEAWRWLAEWAQRSREGSADHSANDFLIVHCRLLADGRCDVGDCLEKLYSMGFRSLMVEGGATVISSFLRGCGEERARGEGGRSFDRQLVDRVVITIAPTFLQGYNVLATDANACDTPTTSASGFPLPLLDVDYVRLGQDLVVVGAPTGCGQ